MIIINKKHNLKFLLEASFFLFWSYLDQVLLKFNDLGHFQTANTMGFSKNVKDFINGEKNYEVTIKNFDCFFGHPVYWHDKPRMYINIPLYFLHVGWVDHSQTIVYSSKKFLRYAWNLAEKFLKNNWYKFDLCMKYV